jgi:prevent-host-death family protein
MKIGLSDMLIGVQEITATDAARTFRELLDQVERDGESYRITRHGRIVAELHPARRGSLPDLVEFARANRVAHPGTDDDWAADIAWVRDQSAPLDDPWSR